MTTDKKRGISLRGRSFEGTVISARMQKTATVEWGRRVDLPKYERYTTRRTRVKAHNPESIRAEEGDIVRIRECRPLSKTKNFMIVEKLGKEKGFAQRMEALEAGKKRAAEEEAKETKEKEEKTHASN
ncbi:MAG: 30S ribosomal protein S17 [Nanoarchaeota archaeon]|nr:30S ribosomal protein S17 [Nanoarchaeota archaeon]